MPKKKKVQHSRAPQARMIQIHNELQRRGGYPNATKLAKILEVSRKTVQRDIDYMRDQMNMPIEYDASMHGLHYTEYVDALPTMQISESEIFSMLVAEKAMQQYKGTPYEQPLASAMSKIISGLKGSGHMAMSHLDATVDFQPLGVSRIELAIFEKISEAVNSSKELRFDYRKPGSEKYEKRHVKPYRLVCVQNLWYVITYDLIRKDRRTFALPRMKAVQPGKRFERDAAFAENVDQDLSFGGFTGEAKEEVVIEFDRVAADLIKEQKWHPEEKIEELKGGKIRFTIKVVDVIEIKRWILKWGSHATVIKPVKLKNHIIRVAEKTLKNYDK